MSQTPPSETRLRLRAVLNAQFTVILAVCLVAAAVGGGLVYTTHVDPGTETREETVSSLTVETAYNHSAEVTVPNSVFETGTVLDDRDTYFTRVAPVLDVDAETSYAADAASDVEVSFESVLVIRNVASEGGTVYWDERETLTTETVSGVEPGETASASFALNSSEIDATASEIESELGASPGETETYVTTDVTVDGTINGEPTTYERSIEMTFDHGGDTYSVSDPGVQSDTTEETNTFRVERSYGPLRSTGGPLLLLTGLAGTGGLAYARRQTDFALTPAEREYLSYRDDRSEFAEWITAIRLPDSVHERAEAEASSLRDLVDFAIDNDTGVVEDPATNAYHAVTDEFVYTYRPPALAAEDAVDGEAFEGDAATGPAGDGAADDDAADDDAADDDAADDDAADDGAADSDESTGDSGPPDEESAWVGGDVKASPTPDGRSPDESASESDPGAEETEGTGDADGAEDAEDPDETN